MPKVKATKTSIIHSVLQNFPEEFIKSPNHKYVNIQMILSVLGKLVVSIVFTTETSLY